MATRAIVVPEQNGIPSVVLTCKGFDTQAQAVATGLGTLGLPAAVFEKNVDTYTVPELNEQVRTAIADAVVEALTVQPPEVKRPAEPEPADIMVKGTFEEVNKFFYENNWTDGLPIVPPTVEKVQEFLKFTDRSPDEVIGVIMPDSREATIWSIAVNGVMSGCRPEYMPILISLIEVMADWDFGTRHIGNTPGPEMLITIDGPIIKELDFNYTQGALRAGPQANTSIGRFWRLYLKNVPGIKHWTTDKGTFGGTWRVVLAENMDVIAQIGWTPLSVDQGFKADDNVVTVGGYVSYSCNYSMAEKGDPEATLDRIAASLVHACIYYDQSASGRPIRHQLIISPQIAAFLAKEGYTKAMAKEYLWEHTFHPLTWLTALMPGRERCSGWREVEFPELYCESTAPDRLIPLYPNADALVLTVGGDPDRDNIAVLVHNGQHGYTTSRKIVLPANWDALLSEAQAK